MQNFIQKGENLTLTAPAALVSGQAVLIGSIFCVASGAAASGAQFVGVVWGVFELPRAAALTCVIEKSPKVVRQSIRPQNLSGSQQARRAWR